MWISKQVLKSIVSEADDKYPKETGGVLIGYKADSGDYVIHYCTGPGPRAVHKRLKFIPDHEWQCDQLDKIYSESEGQWVYIGDWHTHPSGTPLMSLLDRRTLIKIAKHEGTGLVSPLMMIGGRVSDNWTWRVHRFVRPALWGMFAVTDSHEPRQF